MSVFLLSLVLSILFSCMLYPSIQLLSSVPLSALVYNLIKKLFGKLL